MSNKSTPPYATPTDAFLRASELVNAFGTTTAQAATALAQAQQALRVFQQAQTQLPHPPASSPH